MYRSVVSLVSSVLLAAAASAAALPAAAAPAASAPAARLPATLEAALTGAEVETDAAIAYEHSIRVTKDGMPLKYIVTRRDPSRPAGERCVIVSATGADGKPERSPLDSCDSEDRLPSYAQLAELVRDAQAAPIAETATEASFRITPRSGHKLNLSGGTVQIDLPDGDQFEGVVHVVKPPAGAPWVDRLQLGLRQPGGNLLAKLYQADLVFVYAPDAATGMRLPRSFDIDVDLTLVGVYNLKTRLEQRFSAFRRVTPAK